MEVIVLMVQVNFEQSDEVQSALSGAQPLFTSALPMFVYP